MYYHSRKVVQIVPEINHSWVRVSVRRGVGNHPAFSSSFYLVLCLFDTALYLRIWTVQLLWISRHQSLVCRYRKTGLLVWSGPRHRIFLDLLLNSQVWGPLAITGVELYSEITRQMGSSYDGNFICNLETNQSFGTRYAGYSPRHFFTVGLHRGDIHVERFTSRPRPINFAETATIFCFGRPGPQVRKSGVKQKAELETSNNGEQGS